MLAMLMRKLLLTAALSGLAMGALEQFNPDPLPLLMDMRHG